MPCQCHIKIHHSIQALDVTQNIRPSLSKLIGYYTGALVVGDNQTLGIGGDSWLPLIFRDLSAFIGRSHASQMPESAQHVTVLTLLLYPQHQFLAVKVYQPVRQKTSNPVTSSRHLSLHSPFGNQEREPMFSSSFLQSPCRTFSHHVGTCVAPESLSLLVAQACLFQ